MTTQGALVRQSACLNQGPNTLELGGSAGQGPELNSQHYLFRVVRITKSDITMKNDV